MLNFDPTWLDLPEPLDPTKNSKEKIKAMGKFYPGAQEAIPDNVPKSRGRHVQNKLFCGC